MWPSAILIVFFYFRARVASESSTCMSTSFYLLDDRAVQASLWWVWRLWQQWRRLCWLWWSRNWQEWQLWLLWQLWVQQLRWWGRGMWIQLLWSQSGNDNLTILHGGGRTNIVSRTSRSFSSFLASRRLPGLRATSLVGLRLVGASLSWAPPSQRRSQETQYSEVKYWIK